MADDKSYTRAEVESIIPGGVKWSSNGEGQIHCPYHDDKNPSCSINIEKGVFDCHACHEKGALRRLLERCGAPAGSQDRGETYNYEDRSGKLVYQSVRVYKDGKKKFYLQRPDGKGGLIIKGAMKGITALPYNLPLMVLALTFDETIFITEGEKDADRLNSMGYTATTNHAGAKHWTPIHAEYLKGADVIICGDYDKEGQFRVDQVVKSLQGIAKSVKILELGYPIEEDHGHDISDWLDAHSKEEFEDLVKKAKELATEEEGEKIQLIPLESVRTANIPPRTWFVEGMITTGFNLIGAKKAVGKTFFALEMAIAIAGGKDFLGRFTTQAGVLYVSMDLDNIAIHERIEHRPPLPPGISIVYDWSQDDKALADTEKILERGDIHVIFFDMFSDAVPAVEINAYESGPVYRKWRKLGQKYKAAIIAEWHTGKTKKADFMDDLIGTTNFTGKADSIITLERERFKPEGKLSVGGNHGIEEKWNMIFENCQWHRSGGFDEDYLSAGDQALIKIIEQHKRLTITDTAALADRNYDSVRHALSSLHMRKLIDRDGEKGPYIEKQPELPNQT